MADIYGLITRLCEKHVTLKRKKDRSKYVDVAHNVKKVRSSVYELILKKRSSTITQKPLLESNDSMCQLFAWVFSLKCQTGNSQRYRTAKKFIDELDQQSLNKDPMFESCIHFLLALRDTADENNTSKDLLLNTDSCESIEPVPYKLFTGSEFLLSTSLRTFDISSITSINPSNFTSKPSLLSTIYSDHINLSEKLDSIEYETKFNFDCISSQKPKEDLEDKSEVMTIVTKDEGYDSLLCSPEQTEIDIWSLLYDTESTRNYTWESFDCRNEKKEVPFACESGPKTTRNFEMILQPEIREPEILCEQFIRNIKYMLVGISSNLFTTDPATNLFSLRKGTRIQGVCANTLQNYCCNLLFCGSGYKFLRQFCDNTDENCGYIQKELSASISRYLAFYRIAALSLPDTVNILSADEHMREMKMQIGILIRVCNKSPSNKLQNSTSSSQLLTVLYQEILKVTDKKAEMVLYSAFYPCCQIYFTRFLRRWLFEGILVDPYEEFMIKSDATYIKSRSRFYWTRAFSLVQNNIPEFLVDLKNEILYCGKIMNLLKLCNPDSSLCSQTHCRSVPFLPCCYTNAQLEESKEEMSRYYSRTAGRCHSRICLGEKLSELCDDTVPSMDLIEQKRSVTIKRIELEKQKQAADKAKEKKKLLDELVEQMKVAAEQKKRQKEEDIALDLALAKENLESERRRAEAIKDESKRLIDYYGQMMTAVDKRTSRFKRQLQVDDDLTNANLVNDNEKILNRINLSLELPSLSNNHYLASPGQESVMNEIYKSKLTLVGLRDITEEESEGTDMESAATTIYESTPATATTSAGVDFADGFHFPVPVSNNHVLRSKSDPSGGRLRRLLQQSLKAALMVQVRLVDAELLRHFVEKEGALEHLCSLRSYFFLLDGEFARRLTEGLFRRMHGPTIMDDRGAQAALDEALRSLPGNREHADRLSFASECNEETNPLGRLSLRYRVDWPLSVLLPEDALDRYRRVFRYLLRLQHASWALRRAFRDLRRSEDRPRELQLYRHVMSHFVQTLQNYTLAEVLQGSWEELRRNLTRVRSLDQLYNAHALYVKTVAFRCLLNRKCAPIMRVLEQLLELVIRFCGCLSHRPGLERLRDMFRNFEQLTAFVFRFARKMARVGYQPHLQRMLDMLNVNLYYGAS